VTRLWHWVLAIVIVLNWTFGTFMSFDNIEWHFYLGYTAIGLVVFRLLWGLIGPAPIRLSALVPTPSATLRYMQSMGSRHPSGTRGHNPLGSLSVIAMLIVIGVQAFTGLFLESEDFFEYGPLNDVASESTVKTMSAIHHILSDIIVILVALHIAAILFYLIWKKENLIKPMLTGWKWVKGNDQ